jgi:hypothetical protein
LCKPTNYQMMNVLRSVNVFLLRQDKAVPNGRLAELANFRPLSLFYVHLKSKEKKLTTVAKASTDYIAPEFKQDQQKILNRSQTDVTLQAPRQNPRNSRLSILYGSALAIKS